METPLHGGATRLRHPFKAPPSHRFLGISSSPPSSTGDELTEDDIFDSTAEPASSTSPSCSSNPNPNYHQPPHHHKHFGILAALPASETRSVFNHKASASVASSASSPSRMIPIIPHPRRPPAIEHKTKLFHQSAPVNVPVLSAAMEERRRRGGFDEISELDDDDDDDLNVHMLPPHEMVAAKETPDLACSVLEGVGRTLKGRDLRQVRNAVWRQTGFLD